MRNIWPKFNFSITVLIKLTNVIPSPLPSKHVELSDIWDTSLEFKTQSSTLISAQSGMGKSTLLHLIYGLREDYAGSIHIDGKNIRELSREAWENLRRENISLVFQDLRLFSHLTAKENLDLIPISNPNCPSAEKMAERLGMNKFLDQSICTLSHGQRQRIAIIRALQKPFSILLLDEPFSHLDDQNKERASLLIQEVVDHNQASVILSSLGDAPLFQFERSLSL